MRRITAIGLLVLFALALLAMVFGCTTQKKSLTTLQSTTYATNDMVFRAFSDSTTGDAFYNSPVRFREYSPYKHNENCSGNHVVCSVFHADGRNCMSCITMDFNEPFATHPGITTLKVEDLSTDCDVCQLHACPMYDTLKTVGGPQIIIYHRKIKL